MVVDLEGFTYMRQDQKGMLVGIYETRPQHWEMDGAPWDYGVELLQENIDRIADELELVYRRYPVLETAGIRKWVNGAFTFSPDGNPLVGPVAGKRGYWLACGVMAGFLQGGGVGKSLAEWMIHGEPEADVYGPRHRPLRRLRVEPRIYPPDDRRILRPPLRDDLSERAAARWPAAEDDARPMTQ